MDFRANKPTIAGVVTNKRRVQDEVPRVILLAGKGGLNQE